MSSTNSGGIPWESPMKLTPEEQRLIRLIREVGWGMVKNIVVKDGRPVMATTERDVKLT